MYADPCAWNIYIGDVNIKIRHLSSDPEAQIQYMIEEREKMIQRTDFDIDWVNYWFNSQCELTNHKEYAKD